MNKVGDIYTLLSDKYNLNRAVVMEICAAPFKFTTRRMADPNDETSIMIPYFGKFRLKRNMRGRKKDYSEHVQEVKRKKYDKRAAAKRTEV